jgi:hypothetical protein
VVKAVELSVGIRLVVQVAQLGGRVEGDEWFM